MFLPGRINNCALFACLLLVGQPALAGEPAVEERLTLRDIFGLEYATDPQISPDGYRIVYVRNSFDIMTDRRRSALWVVDGNGEDHRPLIGGENDEREPRWSPDQTRIAYVANDENGKPQIHVRWMDTGQTARLTRLEQAPRGLRWSPDGRWLAFSMFVPRQPEPLVSLPPKPPGAEWAPQARVITDLRYRFDGAGYLQEGTHQLFVLPAEGGTPRQVTRGPYEHREAPSWTPDSRKLLFSSLRQEGWEYDPRNSEIYELDIEDGSVRALTARKGPDSRPLVSPDGKRIAYLGFDDRLQGYQVTRLHVMSRDGEDVRCLTEDLDRSVSALAWGSDSRRVYFLYDDHGDSRLAVVSDTGDITKLEGVVAGGTSLGRPYSGASFSLSASGIVAFTQSRPDRPSDVARVIGLEPPKRLTNLNADVLDHKTLGNVEAITYRSSHDRLEIQGWILKPPDFDSDRKYPLILEIHGGPFANYGPRFAAELQLYAAAGYVVFYANPRGSTSYGEAFGNAIHHAYPGHDYDDLISGVDAVIRRGFVDPERLYVTGGSGGGVLTAWIVGKTDRFRAAVSAKPVINWYSFSLTADAYPFFYKYWFPGFPWDHTSHYMKRSPISLVGHVKTPTMLLTGEADYRTPISETEQFYQALKLRKVDTAMVRIPGASHGISARPSHLISKVAHILKWFEMHGGMSVPGANSGGDAPEGDGEKGQH